MAAQPRGQAPAARVGVTGKPGGLTQLGSAVNELLENLEQRGERLKDREQLFQRLVETVHDAVLVHRERILFVNSRFLSLLNLSAAEVVGKTLSEFVAPEYVDLVQNNLRRRLLGEPAAERYEVELLGAQGQVTRVELSSSVIDSAGMETGGFLLTALGDAARVRTGRGAGPAARPCHTRSHGRKRHHPRIRGPDRLHQSRRRDLAEPTIRSGSWANRLPMLRRWSMEVLGSTVAGRSGPQGIGHRGPSDHGTARRAGARQRGPGTVGGNHA